MIAQLLAFLITLGLSRFLTVLVRDLANARGWLHAPLEGRHMHIRPMPRLGGVAIYLSFAIMAMLSVHLTPSLPFRLPISAKALYPILGPATLIFLLGLYDDFFGTKPYLKFGVQAIAATWLFLGDISIERLDLLLHQDSLRTTIALPLTIFWVLLITNAFNLIDGLDGLTAGSALFTTLVLVVQSIISDNFEIAFLAILLAGGILGFLRYNFHPASIFLGDSGSLFIGFLISALALAGSQKSTIMLAVAIPVISCGLPIMDVALAVMRRYLNDKPLFSADRDHIHHKLMKLGLSQRNAVLTLYAVSASFAVLSLALLHGGAIVALLVMLTGVGAYLGLRRLHYEEFSELRRLTLQLFRLRQITRNNLRVRRASQLLEECASANDLCKVLRETLEPLGFSGCRLWLADEAELAEPQPSEFQLNGRSQYTYHWATAAGEQNGWEMTIFLNRNGGEALGSLTIYKPHGPEEVLVDINVLTSAFPAALADRVARFTRSPATAN